MKAFFGEPEVTGRYLYPGQVRAAIELVRGGRVLEGRTAVVLAELMETIVAAKTNGIQLPAVLELRFAELVQLLAASPVDAPPPASGAGG